MAGSELSAFFEGKHRADGVALELGAKMRDLDEHAGHVCAVRLGDSRRIACDAVLVSVGAVPNDGLARLADLLCDDGVVVDLNARTSDPRVFAIGDLNRWPLPHHGRLHRLESVPNALEQARQAAAAITGRPPPAAEALVSGPTSSTSSSRSPACRSSVTSGPSEVIPPAGVIGSCNYATMSPWRRSYYPQSSQVGGGRRDGDDRR